MNYLPLAFLTMVFLGLHYFFTKIISVSISSTVIAFVGCVVSFPVILGYTYFTKTPIMPEQKIYLGYAFLVGVPMAIGLITLYLAIDKGPISVVMPIYGLNGMVTALMGIIFLHEPFSVQKLVGIVLAGIAIVLLCRQ